MKKYSSFILEYNPGAATYSCIYRIIRNNWYLLCTIAGNRRQVWRKVRYLGFEPVGHLKRWNRLSSIWIVGLRRKR